MSNFTISWSNKFSKNFSSLSKAYSISLSRFKEKNWCSKIKLKYPYKNLVSKYSTKSKSLSIGKQWSKKESLEKTINAQYVWCNYGASLFIYFHALICFTWIAFKVSRDTRFRVIKISVLAVVVTTKRK